MEKKLYKDVKDKKLCGVCAGLAKYFSILESYGFVIMKKV